MSQDKYIVVVKPDQTTFVYTGYTPTNLIGSGATVTTNVSGNTWIITSTLSGSTSWGDLVGTITNQTDLINYISGQTSGLTSSWSGLTGLPSDNSDLVDYVQSEITGASTTLVGSGGTWTGKISGDTWVVYSPDWTADILGLTMSAQTAYECCTGNTADIAYISGVTDNHYDSFTGLSSYVINLLVPAISGNTNDINYLSGITSGHTLDISYLSGQTDSAIQCCTGLTATFNDYTGDTFITLSGITVAGALLQAQTNNLQQAFTGHTGTTEIHTPYSAITFAISAATSGLTSSWSGLTGLPMDNADLAAIITGITADTQTNYECCTGNTADIQWLSGYTSGHTHSYNNLTDLPDLNAYTLTGTTAALSDAFDTYTGTTAPATYALKSLALTGGTNMGTTSVIHATPVSGQKLQLKGFAAQDAKIVVSADTTNIKIGFGAVTLDNLSNVTVPTPSANDIIKYSGSTWVNEAPLDIFANVDDLEYLRRNGTSITGVTTIDILANVTDGYLLARNGTDITGVTQGKFSLSGHTHAQYLTGYTLQCSAVTACTNGLYAAAVHTHAISGVTGLQAALDAKSGTGHTHSTYATKASVQTYTGTTAPATYPTKTVIQTYTGTTAPATFAPILYGITNNSGATYSVLTTDNNKIVRIYHTDAATVTLPTNLPIGFHCVIFIDSAGGTLTATSGTLYGDASISNGSGCAVYKYANHKYLLINSI